MHDPIDLRRERDARNPPIFQLHREHRRAICYVSDVFPNCGYLLIYYLASLDEHAFTTLPEVGAAPDMIGDDLPRNVEYLDDYGAAAGLKELSDDELDAFDDYEPSPISESDNVNVISRFGGETIKMLGGDKLNIIEDYFENMTPEPADGSAG